MIVTISGRRFVKLVCMYEESQSQHHYYPTSAAARAAIWPSPHHISTNETPIGESIFAITDTINAIFAHDPINRYISAFELYCRMECLQGCLHFVRLRFMQRAHSESILGGRNFMCQKVESNSRFDDPWVIYVEYITLCRLSTTEYCTSFTNDTDFEVRVIHGFIILKSFYIEMVIVLYLCEGLAKL